jgi:hypothetical protein
MSSRNMCLLPRATLHSDSEQLLLLLFCTFCLSFLLPFFPVVILKLLCSNLFNFSYLFNLFVQSFFQHFLWWWGVRVGDSLLFLKAWHTHPVWIYFSKDGILQIWKKTSRPDTGTVTHISTPEPLTKITPPLAPKGKNHNWKDIDKNRPLRDGRSPKTLSQFPGHNLEKAFPGGGGGGRGVDKTPGFQSVMTPCGGYGWRGRGQKMPLRW